VAQGLDSKSPIVHKINRLLSTHPAVSVKDSEVKEKFYAAEHSDVYPDPKVGFAFRSYPYRGGISRDRARPDTPGMTGNEYFVSQEIPFPGKLNLEKSIKKFDSEIAIYNSEWNKNNFLRNYFETILVLNSIEKEILNLEDLNKSLSSLSKLESTSYSAGKNNLTGTLRSMNVKEKVKDRLIQRNIFADELRLRLEYFHSNQAENQISSQDIVTYLQSKEEELLSGINDHLLKDSPILKITDTNVSKANLEIQKDEILHYPDTEVFVSYMQRRQKSFLLDSGPLNYAIMDNPEYSGDLWSAGITMRIPVWSLTKQSDLTKSNSFKLDKVKKERELQHKLLETELNTALKNWRGNKTRSENFKKSVLATFQRSYSASLAGYSKGDISLTESLQFLNDSTEMIANSHEIELNRWLGVLKILEITNHLLPLEEKNYEK
jgi:outer membrane protein TolC